MISGMNFEQEMTAETHRPATVVKANEYLDTASIYAVPIAKRKEETVELVIKAA